MTLLVLILLYKKLMKNNYLGYIEIIFFNLIYIFIKNFSKKENFYDQNIFIYTKYKINFYILFIIF